MEIFWGPLLVFVLYLRTLNYNYIIDDNVIRDGYLYDVPEMAPDNDFYAKKPSWNYRLFMISMHAVNALLVSMLWGWKAGLLYAAHPIGVTAVAWVTGNYYATTAYFTLIGMYFLFTFGGWFGMISSAMFYWVACYSTITAVGVPLIFLFSNPLGLLWFLPLGQFFTSNRWKVGLENRASSAVAKKHKVTWRKLAIVPRVLTFYLGLSFFPNKLGFFRDFGNGYYRYWDDGYEKFDGIFWGCSLVLLVALVLGCMIDTFATVLFICTILPFVQIKILGQFTAERYLQIPIIGVCILLAHANPYVYTVIVTAFIYRSYLYTSAFKDIESLHKNDIENFNDSPFPLANLASYYIGNKGDAVNTAFSLLSKARDIEAKTGRQSFEVTANLAVCYIYRRQGNHALAYTEKALELGGDMLNATVKDILIKQRDHLLKERPPNAINTG